MKLQVLSGASKVRVYLAIVRQIFVSLKVLYHLRPRLRDGSMAGGGGDGFVAGLCYCLLAMMTRLCSDGGVDARVIIQIDCLMDVEWNGYWLRGLNVGSWKRVSGCLKGFKYF